MARELAFSRSSFVRRALGGTRHGGRFHRIFAGLRWRLEKIGVMKWPSLSAIASVAYKEFLHIYRDRRVLLLLIILPPLFTLIFGHAFENTELTDVPALLIDRDQTPRTAHFIEIISKDKTFHWRMPARDFPGESDLIGNGVKATLVIAVHRLRRARRDRVDFAIANCHAHGLHHRPRTRIGHTLSIAGDFAAAR